MIRPKAFAAGAMLAATVILGGALIIKAQGVADTAPAYVENIANSMAQSMGDASPTSAQYVLTTRQTAEQMATGSTVDSNQQVYLVVLHGTFVDKYARIPEGTAAPTGSEIEFTIDPSTQQVLDFSISSQKLDLSQLGTPQMLQVGP